MKKNMPLVNLSEENIEQRHRIRELIGGIRSGKITREDYVKSRLTAQDPDMLKIEISLHGGVYGKMYETLRKSRRES